MSLIGRLGLELLVGRWGRWGRWRQGLSMGVVRWADGPAVPPQVIVVVTVADYSCRLGGGVVLSCELSFDGGGGAVVELWL